MVSEINKCFSPLNKSKPYRACHQNGNYSFSDSEALQFIMKGSRTSKNAVIQGNVTKVEIRAKIMM